MNAVLGSDRTEKINLLDFDRKGLTAFFAGLGEKPFRATQLLKWIYQEGVEDIDEMVSRLTKHGAQLVGEVVQYEDSYRLCYIRGPEGLLIGLAEELG
jgi:predicted enzyme related to lactoylglutathione lyase